MKQLFVMAALGLACSACQPSSAPPSSPAPSAASQQASAGDSSKPGQATQASATPAPHVAMAEAGDVVPGIPNCKAGDNRTPIPIWKPAVDAQNQVNSTPPQQLDQVVLLTMESRNNPKCNDKDLNTFVFPGAGEQPGGLEINVHGNTQEIEGVCHFNGLYRSSAGTPTQTGRTAIQFSAVDVSEIASPNTYCVQAGH